jgi:TonB family protein
MDDVAFDNTPGMIRLGDSVRRARARPGPGAFAISIALHAAAAGAFFFAGMKIKKEIEPFQTVAIHLVSPPPTVLGEPEPIQTTAAAVTAPKTETKKVETPVKPKPQTQSATDTKVVAKPNAKPAAGLKPKPGPVGGEDLNIHQEGVPFPYPEYLNNVVRTLVRFLRWSGAPNLTAEVGFYVRLDGTTGGVNLLSSSGNEDFDLAAVAAVENAGKARALGPLPKEWQGDRLRLRFTFVPNN